MDLVKRGLNEGRQKFGDKTKPQIQVDVDPLKDVDAMYAEDSSCNVVEAIADVVEKLFVEAKDSVVESQMVEVSGSPRGADKIASELQFDEKPKEAYLMDKEKLISFLNRCRLKNSEVMLCPRCSSVFDKEASKILENVIPESKKRGKCYADHRPKFSFTKSYIPFINNSSTTNYVNNNGQWKAFVPYAKEPLRKWIQSTHKNVQYGKNNVVKGNTSNVVIKNVTTDAENPEESKARIL